MLYTRKPKNFVPDFEAVCCYCFSDGKILLLKRQSSKYQGLHWGPPAGKVNSNEPITDAIIREIREETGLSINQIKIKYITCYYVRQSKMNYNYHVFITQVESKPQIILSTSEHCKYRWISPQKALQLDLFEDEDQSLMLTFNLNNQHA